MRLSVHRIHVNAGDKSLCQDMSLQIEAGQCWALLGLNGSGKTTLLHSLAGLHPLTAGEVKLDEIPLGKWSRKTLAQHLGLLLQNPPAPFPASVMEFILIGRHPYMGHFDWEDEKDYQIAQQALQQVGLQGFEQRDIQSLSGGEYQRMLIAMLLVQQPSLYLLDEPVNHLDWPHQHDLLRHLHNMTRESTVAMIMALHDVNLAAAYCSHAIMLFKDSQYLAGPVDELLTVDNLQQLYGIEVCEIRTQQQRLFVPQS